MQDHVNNTWKNMFGQSFSDWNACHRLIPNLFLRDQDSIENPKTLSINADNSVTEQHWKQIRGNDWPETWANFEKQELPLEIQKEIKSMLSLQSVQVTNDEYSFLLDNLAAYKNTVVHIKQLKDDGYMVTGVPLKLQSLQEKKQIIKNFSECVGWYNQWVDKNNFGKHYSEVELDQLAQNEEEKLTAPIQQQLSYVNSKLISS
jgi:hypothetical protein